MKGEANIASPFLNALRKNKMNKSLLPTTLCLAALLLGGCASITNTPEFNPKTCMKEVPRKAPGLKIIQGSRTEQNIAADMHPAYCNGQVLLKRMNDEGGPVNAGGVWFKVAVEYTGEVMGVDIVKSEIDSREFLKKVSDMILDSDFTPWQRDDDDDSVFIYPMTFTRWWD